jgi:hypothetical protein
MVGNAGLVPDNRRVATCIPVGIDRRQILATSHQQISTLFR